LERIKELAPQLLPNKDAEIVTYWTNTIDAPANTLPVNWRRWATPTGRAIPKASKGGWKQVFPLGKGCIRNHCNREA